MSKLLAALVIAASPGALHAADFVNLTASGDVGVAGHLGVGLPSGTTQTAVRLLVQDATYPTTFTGLGTSLGIGNGIPNNSFAKLTFGNGNGNAAGIGAQVTGGGTYLHLGTSNNYTSGITNSALVIDPSANVGIGTTTPSGLLHLFSNHADSALLLDQPASPNFDTVIAFREQTTSVWNIGVDQSDSSKFKIAAGANWNNLRTTADDFVTITTAGKVGIGATAPASRLSVQDTSYPTAFTGVNTTANIGYNLAMSQFAKLTFGTGTGGIGMLLTPGGSYLHLGTSNSYGSGVTNSALVIDPNGLVGIGTTAPINRLHVVDSASSLYFRQNASNAELWLANTSNVYSDLHFAPNNADQCCLRGSSYGINLTGANPRLSIGGTDVNRPGVAFYVKGLSQFDGNLAGTAPASADGSIVMTVTGTASVGVGMNATAATNVFGAPAGTTYVGGSNGFPLVLTANAVERMRIDTTGNVGIAAFSGAGAARLNVGLSAGQTSVGTFMMTSENGWIQFLGNSNNQAYNPLVQPGDKALLYTNGPVDTGRLVIGPWSSVASPKGIVIDASGNVGIGMTPTNKLTVSGTISAKEIKVTTTGADYVFEDGYRLRSLDEVARFVAAEKHLPEMMPAKAMQDGGMPVSEVVTKQLAKIEELTLYAIHQQQALDAQQAAQADQQKLIAALREQVAVQQQALAKVSDRLAALETAGATRNVK